LFRFALGGGVLIEPGVVVPQRLSDGARGRRGGVSHAPESGPPCAGRGEGGVIGTRRPRSKRCAGRRGQATLGARWPTAAGRPAHVRQRRRTPPPRPRPFPSAPRAQSPASGGSTSRSAVGSLPGQ